MKIKIDLPRSPRIEMLPLIDVVFLLLVFFIFAMLSMAVHHSQPVDLPVSNTAPVDLKKAVPVTIQKNGGEIILFIENEKVSLDQLGRKLREQKMRGDIGEDHEIQIFADKSVSYQNLFRVLDCIKQAGLAQISLQAAKSEKTP